MENKEYEWVELPSKGRCYPIGSALRSGKVKVSYLTAFDENVMVSKKHVDNETVCDTLLRNKVEEVDVKELCSGDKEAIILWLRRTGYGDECQNIDLGNVKYKEFELISDDNGCFAYTLADGRNITFRYLPYKEEEDIIKSNINEITGNQKDDKSSFEKIYRKFAEPLLSRMVVSVEGEDNIGEWLKKMDFETLRALQKYITDNSPGLDLKTTEGVSFDDSVFYDIITKG